MVERVVLLFARHTIPWLVAYRGRLRVNAFVSCSGRIYVNLNYFKSHSIIRRF